MSKILGKQDFVRAVCWDETTVTLFVGDAGGDTAWDYRVDLSHEATRHLIDQLTRAMDIEAQEDEDDQAFVDEVAEDTDAAAEEG